MLDPQRDFESFMKRRREAASAYVAGDPGPLDKLFTLDDPATFYAPGGGVVEGRDTVAERFKKDASQFAPGSETHFEILHMQASDTLAYWTGYQHAQARFAGSEDKLVPMKLRVTELFRREDKSWRLIHRHADSLAEAQPR